MKKVLCDLTNPEVGFFPMYLCVAEVDDSNIINVDTFQTLVPITDNPEFQYQINPNCAFVIDYAGAQMVAEAIPITPEIQTALNQMSMNDSSFDAEYSLRVRTHKLVADLLGCEYLYIGFL